MCQFFVFCRKLAFLSGYLIIFSLQFCELCAQSKTVAHLDLPFDKINYAGKEHTNFKLTLNGRVKSVVQTSMPRVIYDGTITSVRNQDISLTKTSNERLTAFQEVYTFDSTGRITMSQNSSICFNIPSNSDSVYEPIPIIRKDSGDYTISSKHSTLYKYSEDRLTKIITKGKENIIYKKVFDYDTQGNLTNIRDFSGYIYLRAESVFTLNNYGYPVRVEYYKYNFFKKVPSKKHYVYKYRSSEIRNKKNLKSVENYCYDVNGNMIVYQVFNKNISKCERFVYDSLNNKTLEGRCKKLEVSQDTCLCKNFEPLIGYEYDDAQRVSRRYLIGEWKPRNSDSYYRYDSLGRELEYTEYELFNGNWRLTYLVKYSYTADSEIKEAIVGRFPHDCYPSRYYNFAVRQHTKLDSLNNVVERIAYIKKDVPGIIVRYDYEYDDYGNWVKKRIYAGSADENFEMKLIEAYQRFITYY